MTTSHTTNQIPAKLTPARIDPARLQPGDYLRDLGRFRLIASVTAPKDSVRSVARYLVRFADSVEMDLGIPPGVHVTVWREP